MYSSAAQAYHSPQASSSSSLASNPAPAGANAPTPHLHGLGMTPSLPSLSQMHYAQPSYPPHLPSPRIDHAAYAPVQADADWPPHTRLRSHEFTELPVHRPSPVQPSYPYRTVYSGQQQLQPQQQGQGYYSDQAGTGSCPSSMPSPPHTPRLNDGPIRQVNAYTNDYDQPQRIPLAPIRSEYLQSQSQHHPRAASYDPPYHSAPLGPSHQFDSAGRFFRRTSDPEHVTQYPAHNPYATYHDEYEHLRTVRSAVVSPKGGQSKIRFDGPPMARSRTVSAASTFSFLSDEDKHETVTPFISKLNHLLSIPEYSHFIRWNAEGTCFVFAPQSQELLEAFARFFRHSNIHSFVRQLNIYGFSRLSMLELLQAIESTHPPDEPLVTSDFAGFGHPAFFRSDECDLTRIKPKVVQKKKSRRTVRDNDLAPQIDLSAHRSIRGIREEATAGGMVSARKPY